MLVAVMSDIHSNFAALTAVLEDIEAGGVERIYSLGDVVGYGPFPLECLDTLLSNKLVRGLICGNHDSAVGNFFEKINEPKGGAIDQMALAGMRYSRWQIAPPLLAEINSWPQNMVVEDIGLSLAHGAFADDHLWRYVCKNDQFFANQELESAPTKICAIGHTHQPFAYRKGIWEDIGHGALSIGEGKFLINVGSVGQPRDLDPRASYGLFNFGKETTFVLRRIPYDISKTVEAIKKAGLPEFLHKRLLLGE